MGQLRCGTAGPWTYTSSVRSARALLLICLTVALALVVFACRAHLTQLESSLRETERRKARATHEGYARHQAALLTQALDGATPYALYSESGTLLRPAPPSQVRDFVAPVWSVTVMLIGNGKLDEAMRSATTSAERARVLLARGTVGSLDDALLEPAVVGTDLALLVRLRRFRALNSKPDPAWIDDVSALLGGPSERLGRTLLAQAETEPVSSPAERHKLASYVPQPGVFRDGNDIVRVTREQRGFVLRRAPIEFVTMGAIELTLPEPYEMLHWYGDIKPGVVQAEFRARVPGVIALYGAAGLLLLVGSVYAFLAIGRAYRLSAAKTDFVANVTHELKTPLANIRLYAESLRSGRVRSEDQAEFLDTILDEGQRLESLVDGLLHAARGSNLAMRPLDPAELLREVETRWRPRLEKEGFALTATVPALPRVQGDRAALLRALDNLLDNARKYGRQDKRIELGGRAENGNVLLVVRDHGAGIPVGDRERVLRPFTRLESADRKETPGTGLGLSLVVSTMEAHEGAVRLRKAAGGGTEVTLSLPEQTT